ncbi:MAG: hypothetical protein ACE5I7_18300 [Candidatus Binatia bacterium]
MQLTAWVGLAMGVVMVSGAKVTPPPVILDLGPVVPTPMPTPQAAQRKRLITTITVRNAPDGETVVSFEATDVADEGKGKIRTLASKDYSLAEVKPALKESRDKIMHQVRELEREMLRFAEKAGPPKERALLNPAAGSRR